MTAYYNEIDARAAAWLRELIADGLIAHGEVDERSIVDVAASDLKGFTQHHFFAGIGGWSYALRLADWPDDLPVWTASLPCQPFSAAGKGLGKQDERHLLPHFISLVAQCRPTVLFGEQVSAAIKHGWLDDLYTEMEANNYAVGSIVIGAHSIGAAHIRQRLYWVANSIGNDNQRAIRRIGREAKTAQVIDRQNVTQSGESCGAGADVCGVADSGSKGLQRRGGTQRCLERQNRQAESLLLCNGGLADTTSKRECADELGSDSVRSEEWVAGSSDGLHDSESERRAVLNAEDVGPTDGEVDSLADSSSSVNEQPSVMQAAGDITWIYCRDNKYRPIESGFIKMVDGISCTMVYGSHTIKEEINDETMSTVRKDVGAKKDAVEIGRFDSIQEKEVLQPIMYGESLRRCYESSELSEWASAIEETSKGCVRSMCSNDSVTRASCRRKSDEQQPFKFADVVRQMSPGSTLSQFFCPIGTSYMQSLRKTGDEECVMLDAQQPVSEIWGSLIDKEKDRLELHFSKRCWMMKNPIKPLVTGISSDPFNTQEARTVRLKGYGNAIQVQTAFSFIRAYMETL